MTTIALKGTASQSQSDRTIWTRALTIFLDFCDGAREGREIETRYRTYARMSQPDLASRGMTRADIYRAALIGRPV
jgi:hypothetical protein